MRYKPSKHVFLVIDLTSMGTMNFKTLILKLIARAIDATGLIIFSPSLA
jgi:hypothetical protein